jgi:hypothetical protein
VALPDGSRQVRAHATGPVATVADAEAIGTAVAGDLLAQARTACWPRFPRTPPPDLLEEPAMPRPTVVVTRPAGQSRQLTEALQAAGLDVLSFRCWRSGPQPMTPLRAALGRIEDYALVVFVSPNAVSYGLDTLAQVQNAPGGARWPKACRWPWWGHRAWSRWRNGVSPRPRIA